MNDDSDTRRVINRQKRHRIDRPRIVRFLQRVSEDLAAEGAFTVVFMSDPALRRYNRDYRGKDKATDVLSFPGDAPYLGDILISAETAYNQALQSGPLTFERNLERLALHGLLHLLGYDHETDQGEMRALELRLRRKFRC